ncbi:prenyltransferase/squalene oxidase repeat-containing protein [Streptomyces pathocidini]|uniref:Prenyltransferase/squalene oxidase repeat-containing protein n=1 Tax=Streptomyces pathocidini TaxID=1650571 RepID=A0ABW7URP1_9ACTN|nr:prenyltransferase/squalene oxidase repeat-containing protein [Streptomyces pathocidini]
MNLARRTAALAATAVLCTAAGPAVSVAAAADSPSPKAPADLPSALHGTKDPTYDGVWRQSLALLAQDAAGVVPAGKSVDWLAGQQCASGGFAAYRADATEKCDAKTAVDSNSTAAAVQALAALGGHSAQVEKAAGWLKSVQNQDGGWGYAPGGPSDANSTSVVIGALAASGRKPEGVKSQQGKSPYDALLGFQLGCDAKTGEAAQDGKGAAAESGRGAFAYQPDKKGALAANADATVAAALAGQGKGLLVEPVSKGTDEKTEPLDCGGSAKPDVHRAAAGASAYVADLLEKDSHLTALAPGATDPAPDYANTAEAVIALTAGGHREAAEASLKWLEKNAEAWSKDNPAGLATLVLAAHAAGSDPRDFGGTDLVSALNATGPKPESAEPAQDAAGQKAQSEDDGTPAVWWIIGVGLVAGIGIGFLLSGRKKK